MNPSLDLQADLEASVQFARHPMFDAFVREVRDAAEPLAIAHYARYDGDIPQNEEIEAFIRKRCVEMGNPQFPTGPEHAFDVALGWKHLTDMTLPHVVVKRKYSQGFVWGDEANYEIVGSFALLSDALSCVFDNCVEEWAEAFVAHRRELKAEATKPGPDTDMDYSDDELAAMANASPVTDDHFNPWATSDHSCCNEVKATQVEPERVTINPDASLSISISKDRRQTQIDHIASLMRRASEEKNLSMMQWLYDQMPIGHRYQGFRSDGTLIGPYNEQREAGTSTYDPRSKEA